MKTKAGLFFMSALLLLSAACKTTETKPVSWKERSAYFAKVRDPRIYGFSIYQTPGGVEYRGGTRVHPNQGAALLMKADKPLRPVVVMKGNLGLETLMLLDFSTSASWFDFNLAQKLGTLPVSERTAQVVNRPGEEIAGCISMVPSIHFEQLSIEFVPVYVRLATGFLGPLARGIEKPEIKGVLGWDVLQKIEQIQLDYSTGKILLSTAKTGYAPDPATLIAKIPLVKHAGACAVRGMVAGKESLILIDPAGDFEFATDGAAAVSSVALADDLLFTAPAVADSSGGTRIGARLLRNYRVTVCPQAGEVYFEKPDPGEGK